MKVLIASLQVSRSGSKGHLHPALEVALECKRMGHVPVLLPLPSPFGAEDRAQLAQAGIGFIDPPLLPDGIILSPESLARLASDPENTWKAYHSFLVAPLVHQFNGICELVQRISPDVILYDLLAYGAPLAARRFQIPEVGFCAGLKLIAPEKYAAVYEGYRQRLNGDLLRFLESIGSKADFHHLEMLSNNGQLVFTIPGLVGDTSEAPLGTRLMGAISASLERGDSVSAPSSDFDPSGNYAVLSFGSVLDPADFPEITHSILQVTKKCDLRLIVGSRKFSTTPSRLPPHAKAYSYLPLPTLLSRAKVFFHHGGASSFSEALAYGAPQVLIPLTTDQPIQAHYLSESGAGFAMHPTEIDKQVLEPKVRRFLDPTDEIHQKISRIASEFRKSHGAARAVEYLEEVAGKSQ